MEAYQRACALLPAHLREGLADRPIGAETEELRLRTGQPVALSGPWGERSAGGPAVRPRDLEAVVDAATGRSRYAAAETLRQGYLTAEGGFRIGLCGLAVTERGRVETVRDLSSLSIRIPRQRPGIGAALAEEWLAAGMPNLLILGAPGEGKTTLLRDLVRAVSGRGIRVGLADERGEVAALFRGVPQLDVGPCTDVLEGCPKALALPMLLRTMTPRVLAVDEVAVEADAEALELGANSGAALLATAHAASRRELEGKALFRRLLDRGIFARAVLIRRQGAERRYGMEVL